MAVRPLLQVAQPRPAESVVGGGRASLFWGRPPRPYRRGGTEGTALAAGGGGRWDGWAAPLGLGWLLKSE